MTGVRIGISGTGRLVWGTDRAPAGARLARSVRTMGATMTLVFTDWAVEILRRSHEAARRFNPDATVRVRRDGDRVAFELTDERRDGDALVEHEGFEMWVEAGLEGTVDIVEPHDQLILRPPGDPQRSVRPS